MNISFILAYFSQCYDKVNLRVEVFILVQSKKGVAAGVWGSWPNTLSVVRKDSDEFCMLNLNSQNPRLWNDAGHIQVDLLTQLNLSGGVSPW